jgi:PAS domain S-box-containing protein
MISAFDTTKSQLYHAAHVHLSMVRACRIGAFLLSVVVAVTALVVLARWGLSRPALGPVVIPMNPLTAICLFLIATALVFLLPSSHGASEGAIGIALAAIALALAVATLATFGRPAGPDTWLFHAALQPRLPASRMAPPTALLLAVIALSVLVLDVDISGRRPAQFLILVSLPFTFVVQVGYLFGITELEGWAAYIPMSRTTIAALALLQIAVLAGRMEYGMTRIFVAEGAGGVTARRLFPAVIVVPVVIGYARLLGQRHALYGPEFGVVLFTLAMVAIFSTLVWTTASRVHRVDAERAEIDVRLQTLIRNVPLGIVVLDLDGRVKLCNDAFVELFHYPAHELLGRRVDDLIAPQEDDGETTSLTQRGFAGETVRRRTVRRRRDGTLVDVELFVVPLAMGGRAIGTYGVYRDISDRRMRAQAREART